MSKTTQSGPAACARERERERAQTVTGTSAVQMYLRLCNLSRASQRSHIMMKTDERLLCNRYCARRVLDELGAERCGERVPRHAMHGHGARWSLLRRALHRDALRGQPAFIPMTILARVCPARCAVPRTAASQVFEASIDLFRSQGSSKKTAAHTHLQESAGPA